MKILGVCGSPRKGSTEYIVETALQAVKEYDSSIETEMITMRGKNIKPCVGCGYCRQNGGRWCCIKDDMQELFDKFLDADGFFIASPVYVTTVTPQLAAFFSRMGPARLLAQDKMRNKFFAAAAVGGTRNGGQELTVETIIDLMMARAYNAVSNEARGYMGAKVWSKDNSAADDTDGIESVKNLAKKLAEVCSIYDAGLKYYRSKQE